MSANRTSYKGGTHAHGTTESDVRGHRRLRDLTVERSRELRRTWKYSPLSAAKRLEYLRAFLRFCVEAGWIERNPAAALKPTKVPHKPTLPYTDVEVERLLDAARALVGSGSTAPGSSR